MPPDADPGAIFDRALAMLPEKVENTRAGGGSRAAAKPVYPSCGG
jgi:hypothetical protein